MPDNKRGVGRKNNGKKERKRGTKYLFAVAINAYQHVPKLSNCVSDAKAIIAVLSSKYDFEQANVTTLFDEEATRANIFKGLQELARKIQAEDNLLIYFAGHGAYDKGTGGYLIPVEAAPGHYWDFLSNGNFLNLIKAIKSLHTFLLMDSCFSGSLFRSVSDNSTQLAENIENYPSRWGLAAGMIEEVEDGWRGENSPFAQSVLQYLKSNTHPKFPASELVQYTRRVTPRNAKQTPIGGPLYKVGDLDGEFVFYLKKDEEADWKTAKTTHTLAAYQLYINQYPEGKYLAAAQKTMAQLSAAALWQQIQQAPDENTTQVRQKTHLIDTFIQHHSQAAHYREVLQEGKKMNWKKKFLTAKRDKYALLEFIAEDPPFFKDEAQRLIQEKKEKEAKKQQKPEQKRKVVQPPRDFQSKSEETFDTPTTFIAPPMISIKGGTFQMGDVMGDGHSREKPVHSVTLSDYSIGQYPVTFDEYDAYCVATGQDKPDDSGWGRGRRPVINVSWYNVVAYCNWLSKEQGYTPVYTIKGEKITANWAANGYRLPTEAEWEYAARAGGKKVRFGNGKDVIDPKEINFYGSERYKKPYSVVGTYRGKTVEAGSLNNPNSLGLHDMSGNVWEWCWDGYANYSPEAKTNPKGADSASVRVNRGGSWGNGAEYCRVAFRFSWYPDGRGSNIGFRLAHSS